jgi:hypothetical protein
MQQIIKLERRTPSPNEEIGSIYNNEIILNGKVDFNCNIILDVDHLLFCVVKQESVQACWKEQYRFVETDSHVFFHRPGIEIFLKELFSHFRIGIFTMGSKEYLEIFLQTAFLPLLTTIGFTRNDIACFFHKTHHEQCIKETGKSKKITWISKQFPQFKNYRTRIITVYPDVKHCNEHWAILLAAFRVDQQSSLYDNSLQQTSNSLLSHKQWCADQRKKAYDNYCFY